jgi:glucose-6-phosphate 1-dehydrogenase
MTTSIVIFGASGDLTRRKLIPALFSESIKGHLPAGIRIVGTARSPMTHQQFRQRLLAGCQELAGIAPEPEAWDSFAQNIYYAAGDASQPNGLNELLALLGQQEQAPANRLYYLATSPSAFGDILAKLGHLDMAAEQGSWRRVVVEKPFGRDLDSARALNQLVHAVFEERQVYRIDHYLGKETAQNILYFRFLNTIFEPIWNRNYIDHVQITVAETVDVEHRAGYYDEAGVVRDVFQNHLLQLLTLVAMEPPAMFEADAVRNEKVKLLRAVRPVEIGDTVRGQYEGYQEAAPDSQTPTFAAMRLYLDNWRWQGVPFYLRSGKALEAKISEIVVEFKEPPHVMFQLPAEYHLTPNFLSLCIQPNEGIHLRFETKVPGSAQETRSVDMEFQYSDSFGQERLPDAYERLLMDAVNGDASLFTRSDEIEMAWTLVDPILAAWERPELAPPLLAYPRGSWGPEESQAFLARDGRGWRLGCDEREDT